jgi:hypothetical protein
MSKLLVTPDGGFYSTSLPPYPTNLQEASRRLEMVWCQESTAQLLGPLQIQYLGRITIFARSLG